MPSSPEKARAYQKRWYAERGRALRSRPEWRAIDSARRKANYTAERGRADLLKRYGLTPAEYDALLTAQEGRCAVCPRTTGATGRRLYIDHNHTTGKVRGLLCSQCNCVLGHAEESIERLLALVQYLRKHQ